MERNPAQVIRDVVFDVSRTSASLRRRSVFLMKLQEIGLVVDAVAIGIEGEINDLRDKQGTDGR